MKNKKVIPKVSKPRKVSKGPIKEKARTMNKLVRAVGSVFKKKGYSGLNGVTIAKEAKVDRKLIYEYFGGVDHLVEEFIAQNDFWKYKGKEAIEQLVKEPEKIDRNTIISLLQGQYEVLSKNKVLQKIIHWELGEENPTLRKIADNREEIGEKIFSIIDSDFEKANVDLRAILALQISGIYYLILHAESNGSTFCGVDINEPEGKERILNAIKNIIDYTYDKAGIAK